MIPLKQTVELTKAGGLDEWGQPVPGRTQTLKCRIDQASKAVKTQEGREVLSSAEILFKGLVAVNYGDALEWKDEAGNKHTMSPLTIAVIRDLAGKPVFTKVVV